MVLAEVGVGARAERMGLPTHVIPPLGGRPTSLQLLFQSNNLEVRGRAGGGGGRRGRGEKGPEGGAGVVGDGRGGSLSSLVHVDIGDRSHRSP